MSRYTLLTTAQISNCIESARDSEDSVLPNDYSQIKTHRLISAMALEIREYRQVYGPLGCAWLSAEPHDPGCSSDCGHMPDGRLACETPINEI